jgi:hypothetical protein
MSEAMSEAMSETGSETGSDECIDGLMLEPTKRRGHVAGGLQ